VRALAGRFVPFCRMFEQHFQVYRKDMAGHARHYLSGLLGRSGRKNLQGIEENVAESDYEGLQHFLSDSPWDQAALMTQVAQETDRELGGHEDTALYVDETSFVKKGRASVGVQRQYCGRLGKLENCQVGVFLAQGRGERVAAVDFRLFLPEAWAQDAQRCAKAKVPEAERRHRTKTELALEMIESARARGSRHGWIGGDEVYGNNSAFTAALEDLGEVFLMDVAANHRVWTSAPSAPKPVASGRGRGRPATRPAAPGGPIAVEALAEKHFAAQAREVQVRATTKGALRVRVWAARVWQHDGQKARERWLVVREEADGSRKYSLGNPPADTPWERLAFMQAQRFWIERSFQDAKSELGLADYELRGWTGWHHHIALVCLAQLFTLRERRLAKATRPLLSVRDLTELLELYLPRRPRTEQEVLRQIDRRHRARQRDLKRRGKKAPRNTSARLPK
jgi:SRSO17 transposase